MAKTFTQFAPDELKLVLENIDDVRSLKILCIVIEERIIALEVAKNDTISNPFNKSKIHENYDLNGFYFPRR